MFSCLRLLHLLFYTDVYQKPGRLGWCCPDRAHCMRENTWFLHLFSLWAGTTLKSSTANRLDLSSIARGTPTCDTVYQISLLWSSVLQCLFHPVPLSKNVQAEHHQNAQPGHRDCLVAHQPCCREDRTPTCGDRQLVHKSVKNSAVTAPAGTVNQRRCGRKLGGHLHVRRRCKGHGFARSRSWLLRCRLATTWPATAAADRSAPLWEVFRWGRRRPR